MNKTAPYWDYYAYNKPSLKAKVAAIAKFEAAIAQKREVEQAQEQVQELEQVKVETQ